MNRAALAVRARPFAPLAIILVGAAITVAAYLQALNYPFVSDDTSHITTNTKLLELQLSGLWRLFTEPFNAFFEFLPLRELSFWLDINLFGLNPTAFRIHNIFLYLLCLPLVYGSTLGIWRYLRPSDTTATPWAAAAVTTLFAIHPTLVESVVWISGRKYVLPNLFAMIALWFAIHARRTNGLYAPYATAAALAFIAMMLSKASYVAVAPVIAMLWIIFWYDAPALNRQRSQLLWPLSLLILAGILLRSFMLIADYIFSARGEFKDAYYFGIETATRSLASLGWLARLAVSPESRHFFYPVLDDPNLTYMVTLGVAVLVVATVGMVMILRKRSLEGFAMVTFLLLCLPYMQFVPYATPSLIHDRHLSLAIWPAILLIVALAWRLKPPLRIALLLLIALPWYFQTAERTRDWRSLESIIETDLRAYPGYYMPAEYKIIGGLLPQGLYRDAIETAKKINAPEFRDAMIKLVKASFAVHVTATSSGNPMEAMTLLWQLGIDLKKRPDQAKWNSPVELFWIKRRDVLLENWKYLAEKFPDNESVRYNAGLWLLGENQTAEAVPHLRAATESQRLPQSVRGTAFRNLGLALLHSGQAAEAEIPLRAALEQSSPDMRAHCALMEVYKEGKRHEEAARAETDCSRYAPEKTAR